VMTGANRKSSGCLRGFRGDDCSDWDLLPVLRLFRNNKSDAATWVGNVSLVPWNHMNVKLRNCLSSNCTVIEPNVESVRGRSERCLQVVDAPIDPVGQPRLLRPG